MLKVMTYNINYSRRATVENGWGFYSWPNRASTIYQILKSHDPDVLMIQELHEDYRGEFMDTMTNYYWFFMKQNARGGVTYIGIGFKRTLDHFKFGEYNFNQHNNEDIKDLENSVYCVDDLTNTIYISVHLPMNLDCRMKTSELISILTKPFDHAVIGGDFNSSSAICGYQQMLKTNAYCGTHSLSEYALFKSTNMIATKSFIPYPYDYVPQKWLDVPGKLDHLLGKNVIPVGNVIVDDTCMEETNIMPSDHMPIICVIDLLKI
jgi:endonuclease/exonuclease/phosphatase family metal-dependent hydrolase